MRRDWIDVVSEETQQTIRSLLTTPPEEGTSLFLLLDRAFAASEEWDKCIITSMPGLPLFGGKYEGEGVEQVSPWLYPVPEQYAALGSWLDSVLRLCAGRPMLNVLQTDLALQELRRHLQQRLEASAAGETFIVRYADTRCLPQVFAVLEPRQRAAFLKQIDAWWYVDRDGLLKRLLKQQSSDIGPALPLNFSSRQHQALQAAALPDTLIAYLRERQDVFGHLGGKPSVIYGCVSAVLDAQPDLTQIRADVYREVLSALEKEGLLLESEATQDA